MKKIIVLVSVLIALSSCKKDIMLTPETNEVFVYEGNAYVWKTSNFNDGKCNCEMKNDENFYSASPVDCEEFSVNPCK